LIVPCSIKRIVVEAHCNPIREVHIMSWHSARTVLHASQELSVWAHS
jgi:hypothetical protein